MDSTASKLGIMNDACIMMGTNIMSSESDGSKSAQVIVPSYRECLQLVLEEHPWSFATKTRALATLAITPVDFGDGASIVYSIPEDYLKLYLINYPNALIRQENISGEVVWVSDTSGLIIKYVFLNDDPTTYSAKFRQALAAKISAKCCFKLVEATANATKFAAEYDKFLLSAMSDDSKDSTPDQPFQDNIFYERMAGANAVVGNPNGNIGFFVGQSIGF